MRNEQLTRAQIKELVLTIRAIRLRGLETVYTSGDGTNWALVRLGLIQLAPWFDGYAKHGEDCRCSRCMVWDQKLADDPFRNQGYRAWLTDLGEMLADSVVGRTHTDIAKIWVNAQGVGVSFVEKTDA